MARYIERHLNFKLLISQHALDRLDERTSLLWEQKRQAFRAVAEECKSRALSKNDVVEFEACEIWWTVEIHGKAKGTVITARPSDWVNTDYSMSEWV